MGHVVSRWPLTSETWNLIRVGFVVDQVTLERVLLRELPQCFIIYHRRNIIFGNCSVVNNELDKFLLRGSDCISREKIHF